MAQIVRIKVPDKVWDLYKKSLRKILKVILPSDKLQVAEFEWRGFSALYEYIRITQIIDGYVKWTDIISIVDFMAYRFGMQIDLFFLDDAYSQKTKSFNSNKKYLSVILNNTRTWTTDETTIFLDTFSYSKLETECFDLDLSIPKYMPDNIRWRLKDIEDKMNSYPNNEEKN